MNYGREKFVIPCHTAKRRAKARRLVFGLNLAVVAAVVAGLVWLFR